MVDFESVHNPVKIPELVLKETLELIDWHELCLQFSTFACTPQAKKECKQLSLPADISTTRRMLAETLEIGHLEKTMEGGLSFSEIYEISSILGICVKGGIASGAELFRVNQTIKAAKRIKQKVADKTLRPVTTELVQGISSFSNLLKVFEFGLDEGGRVADRASNKLFELRQHLRDQTLTRRGIINDLLRKFSFIVQDNVITERNGRPVISLKIGSADQIGGIIHDTSGSGNTIFLEPQSIIPLGNKIVKLQAEILEEEKRLLSIWSRQVADCVEDLEIMTSILLEIELAFARARYGDWLGGKSPLIDENSECDLLIKGFRHPLLYWQYKHKSGFEVVPTTFEISSQLRVVAITGPNTGGKTIALKSIGLAVLMARCGMLIPCDKHPSLPWFNQVLADIGDEQSIEQSLSTFSGHIVRIKRIIDAIDQRSGPALVLLDEVGAGTDPTEGTALAISLLKTFANRAKLTIATTHFGELKALKYSDERFENASVAFDSETMKPTFHLQWGIPGKSNALAIARRLGLDVEIISQAKRLVAPKGIDDVNQIIKGLEEQKLRQQKAAEDASELLARTELLHDELLLAFEEQRKKHKDFNVLGKQMLQKEICDGQQEVRELIKRLRKKNADGEVARKAGRRLRQIQIDTQHQIQKKENLGWRPEIGEKVKLVSIGKSADVLSISEDSDQITVLCGVFRSVLDLSEVESLDGRKPISKEPFVHISSSSSNAYSSKIRTRRNTLDVRGLRVHEAEVAVEEAIRNTVGKLWVIHGIGTGKLKIGLRKWLKTLPYVERVTDAEQRDGGTGCSVVWLR